MKRRLDQLLGKHHKSSCNGPALRDHQRRTAAELLAAGLEAVGLDPQQLASTRKTDPRKQAVAWLLRKNTTVGNRWVTSQLNMGHEVNVSQAVRLIEEAKSGQRARLRNAVAKALEPEDCPLSFPSFRLAECSRASYTTNLPSFACICHHETFIVCDAGLRVARHRRGVAALAVGSGSADDRARSYRHSVADG